MTLLTDDPSRGDTPEEDSIRDGFPPTPIVASASDESSDNEDDIDDLAGPAGYQPLPQDCLLYTSPSPRD